MKRVNLLVGVVEANERAGRASVVTSIIDQYNSDSTGFKLVVESAQTGAASSNIVSIASSVAQTQVAQRIMPNVNLVGISRWLGASIPFFGITTNAYAGSVTFLKITADITDDDPNTEVRIGDVFNLISNISGLLLSVAVLGASPGIVMVLAGISFISTAGAIVSSDSIRAIYDKLVEPVWERYYKDNPSSEFSGSLMASDLTIVSTEELYSSYDGVVLRLLVDSEGGDVVLSNIKEGYDQPIGGSGGGYAAPSSSWVDDISIGGGGISQSQNQDQDIPVIVHDTIYVNSSNGSDMCTSCHNK